MRETVEITRAAILVAENFPYCERVRLRIVGRLPGQRWSEVLEPVVRIRGCVELRPERRRIPGTTKIAIEEMMRIVQSAKVLPDPLDPIAASRMEELEGWARTQIVKDLGLSHSSDLAAVTS